MSLNYDNHPKVKWEVNVGNCRINLILFLIIRGLSSYHKQIHITTHPSPGNDKFFQEHSKRSLRLFEYKKYVLEIESYRINELLYLILLINYKKSIGQKKT